jgi:hypothetical protein
MLAHPGPSWAVSDVYDGLFSALARQGHEVVAYSYGGRIANSGRFLTLAWRRAGKPEGSKPGPPDVAYMATQGILERALSFDIDWTICICGLWLHPMGLELLRKAHRKVAIVMTESPYEVENEGFLAERCDAVFTTERTMVEDFRASCERSYYLPHSYDPKRHHPGVATVAETAAHDVVFVGTAWQERIDMLRGVNWEGVDLGLYGTWSLLGSRDRLRQYVQGGVVANEAVASLYAKAKIGLNLHRTSMDYDRHPKHILGAESVNPRVLELAACGRFVATDWRAEVEEIFGDLLPTFRNSSELQEIVGQYLQDDVLREEVAKRLPDVVRGRTFDNAACLLVKYLSEE